MSLTLTEDEKRFLRRLVLANCIAWPVGVAAAIILSGTIGSLLIGKISVLSEIIPKENNLIVGLCMGGAVGYAQWLVIKKYFKISTWWIFASAVGLGIPWILEALLPELAGIGIDIDSSDLLGQAAFYFIGGLLAGLLQYNIFRSLTTKCMWWIIISPFVWGISVFGIYILSGVIQGLISGMAFLRLFDFPIRGDQTSNSPAGE